MAESDYATALRQLPPWSRILARWLRRQVGEVSAQGGPRRYGYLQAVRAEAWLRDRLERRRYRHLTEAELGATRRSDRLFIFGSGYSLHDLTPEEWRHVERHDTLGFNWFVHQRFVRCDYHLIRGIPDSDLDRSVWQPQLREYFQFLRTNPLFANTIYLVQEGFSAINGNRAIGYRLLSDANPVYRWQKRLAAKPGQSLGEGLVLIHSTLDACISFGHALGWREIVLVGVDLYDRRYFWLRPDETRSIDERRNATYQQTHSRGLSMMAETYREWARVFAERGTTLSVYNPRSLLASVLPVYALPDAGSPGAPSPGVQSTDAASTKGEKGQRGKGENPASPLSPSPLRPTTMKERAP